MKEKKRRETRGRGVVGKVEFEQKTRLGITRVYHSVIKEQILSGKERRLY